MSPAQRSMIMRRIRSTDTQPEIIIRRALHARGLRFRLHRGDLPGRPDLYFSASRTAVFVHGCFWHLHGCALSKVPTTRTDYWSTKLASNRARDQKNIKALEELGIRVIIVWECAIRSRAGRRVEQVADELEKMIRGSSRLRMELAGAGQAASDA